MKTTTYAWGVVAHSTLGVTHYDGGGAWLLCGLPQDHRYTGAVAAGAVDEVNCVHCRRVAKHIRQCGVPNADWERK